MEGNLKKKNIQKQKKNMQRNFKQRNKQREVQRKKQICETKSQKIISAQCKYQSFDSSTQQQGVFFSAFSLFELCNATKPKIQNHKKIKYTNLDFVQSTLRINQLKSIHPNSKLRCWLSL